MNQWRDAYDRVGITANGGPPRSLVHAVAACDVLASSDLPRALESMERLAPDRNVIQSPLLREAPLPDPSLPFRLPVLAWDALATVHWGYRILRGTDASPADRDRAREAFTWLAALGGRHAVVAVTTHGVFRRLLALQCEDAGWSVVRPRPGYRYWSVWTAAHRPEQ